jgi:hypothetical protein
MSAHTPGPWAVWPMGRYLVISCTGSGMQKHPQEGMHVAHVKMPDENKEWDQLWEANARLIAAAPELLQALIDLDEAYCDISSGTCRESRESGRNALIAARAAIAKASGGAQS